MTSRPTATGYGSGKWNRHQLPTTKPKTIDVTFTAGERKGKTAQGIYEIEDDAFRVCIARPGDERPAEFSAKAGSGRTLIVYKREKK